jgi:excinuclease ABC subunit A
MARGTIAVLDLERDELAFFSRHLMCPTSGIAYQEPEPNTFSFNSPKGACPMCDGLGTTKQVNQRKLFPDPKQTIRKGGNRTSRESTRKIGCSINSKL